eukprot:GEMP01034632.1.p1 GENE.GEMP01034632.1~~GEMP01034632.1.p1  ORF type:complete len:490 (+),score=117.78 GEMP01034632.1:78-1472(+)
MAAESALFRLRDSLSQLGQLDFRSERSQNSVDDMWSESPQPRIVRPALSNHPSPALRATAVSNPDAVSTSAAEKPAVALTNALRSCRERCSQLESKRGQAKEELRISEDDKARLQLSVARVAQENKQLLQDREKKLEANLQLRQDLRTATDQLADLDAQMRERMKDFEAQRHRLERLVEEQRRHIESLEQTRHGELEEVMRSRETIERLGKGTWALLEEKAKCAEFLTNLVSSMQSLFYNPTPFVTQARMAARRCGGVHTLKRLEVREGVSELRELLEQLEEEIADSSQAYSKFIQRLLQREDEMKRIVAIKPTNVLEQIQVVDSLLMADQKRLRRDVSSYGFTPGARASSLKASRGSRGSEVDTERGSGFLGTKALRGSRGSELDTEHGSGFSGTKAPRAKAMTSVDWAAEMLQFQQITSTMETKFIQLTKLKNVIQSKSTIGHRASATNVRSRSVGRLYTTF